MAAVKTKYKDVDIAHVMQVVIAAGKKLNQLFKNPSVQPEALESEHGNDNIVAQAERAAHEHVLAELNSPYPVFSDIADVEPLPKNTDTYWLLDPLSGAREFAARHEDFCLTLALIDKGYPVLGFIYAPLPEYLWLADSEKAWQCEFNKTPKPLKLPQQFEGNRLKAVASDADDSSSTEEQLSQQSDEVVRIAGALKFCMIARGDAHLYYRNNVQQGLHVAAGQALVEQSGGAVTTETGERPSYQLGQAQFTDLRVAGCKQPDITL